MAVPMSRAMVRISAVAGNSVYFYRRLVLEDWGKRHQEIYELMMINMANKSHCFWPNRIRTCFMWEAFCMLLTWLEAAILFC